jgi:60S ribosome subunit biogenesis protein NIP7
MIKEFINHFCEMDLEYIQINDSFYIIEDSIKEVYNKIEHNKDLSIDAAEYVGFYLGKVKRNKFIPSFSLLELISSKTDQKVIINSRASWLFLCGRDVFKKSIVDLKYGYVLVLNQENEILGYGFSDNNGVKNHLDKGDFLRREK